MSRLTALKIAKSNVDRIMKQDLAEELGDINPRPIVQIDRLSETLRIYYGQEE